MLRRGKVGRKERGGGGMGMGRGVEPFIHVICRLYGQTTWVTCLSVSLWGRESGREGLTVELQERMGDGEKGRRG